MRKQIKLINPINMAGTETTDTYFFHKQSESERVKWLWVVSSGHSWMIGWDYHLKGIQIYSLNRFSGMEDFYRKGYTKADPDMVKDVLQSLRANINQFIEYASMEAA